MNLGDWIVPFIAIGIPLLVWILLAGGSKEAARQSADRKAEDAEIQRRAAAAGRSLEPRAGDEIWRQVGKLPGGEPWTLSYFNTGLRVALPPGEPSVNGDEWLVLRCQALERAGDAFALRPRTKAGKLPGEIPLQGEVDVRRRWVLLGPDESVARRAFGPATCELLLRLPADVSGLGFDERSAITLNRNGLVATLAFSGLTADLVDLWMEICETLAGEIRRP